MNSIKRMLGIVWMLMGPMAVFFMVNEALKANQKAIAKIASASTDAAKNIAEMVKINSNLQWGIIITVFVPIMIGLVIFGWYALKGDYDHLPESSLEIED
jgi:hypothetical protein